MEERFPDEFVTWRHKTPMGVKVEEVFGMDSKTGRVWIELARQIYSEKGEPDYRVVDHFLNGAPFLENYPGRISITHTDHFFAVAMLPKTPEINLQQFSQRAALGIDAEPQDRQQVLKVRSKFLSDEEQLLIPSDDLKTNIQAWTVKEALYKAAMTEGVDFKNNLSIISLPPVVLNPEDKNFRDYGKAIIKFSDENADPIVEMNLFSYLSYNCIVSIAFSPKCAKFGK